LSGSAAAAPLVQGAGSILPIVAGKSFTFARVRYSSGNWDTDPRMPSNLLNALTERTLLRIDHKEHIVALDSEELLSFPFAYMTGNHYVALTAPERENFVRYIHSGGFLFVDDCNHDLQGDFALSFESESRLLFDGARGLHRLSGTHPIYRSYYDFGGVPPATSQELNGWGDDLVHDYLQAIEINKRVAVLYSNKDYGCEWDYTTNLTQGSPPDSIKFGINMVVYAVNL